MGILWDFPRESHQDGMAGRRPAPRGAAKFYPLAACIEFLCGLPRDKILCDPTSSDSDFCKIHQKIVIFNLTFIVSRIRIFPIF